MFRPHGALLSATVIALSCAYAMGQYNGTPIELFEGKRLPKTLVARESKVKSVKRGEGRALEVRMEPGDRPGIALAPVEGTWDWSAFSGVAVDVENPEKTPLRLSIGVESQNEKGKRQSQSIPVTVGAGEKTTLRVYFENAGAGPYWGMRGIPVYGPLSMTGTRMSSAAVTPSRITALQITATALQQPGKLIVDDIRGFAKGSALEPLVPYPFIDRYGQYVHADWPGKIEKDADFAAQRETERKTLAAMPQLPGRDKFGGWADGPQLKATGWFRTENVDGKWWLVTPEGHLFFSVGVNSIYAGVHTFVTGRENWFEGLPDDERYARCWSETTHVHSMGEAIGGKGRTFNFYGANLLRKYGDDWYPQWRDMAYARLRSWGLNTIGNWSDGGVLTNSPIPFVTTLGTSARPIEGSEGFWGKMLDVYDPEFEKNVDNSFSRSVPPFAGNPLCIGYFVDNEMSWESIAPGTLSSPPNQPARQALVEQLKRKYPTIGELNGAWGTQYKDWDALAAPKSPNETLCKDLDEFVYAFSRRYFEVVQTTLKKYAPNQLYLGCRFALGTAPVFRACADVADVVSFNMYRPIIRCEDWTGPKDLGKPILIGEFHFGATDRGMFHTGLQGAANQKERAEAYMRYVRSVADCPAFVGCHWFEYEDEPTTGRCMDGENFSIGFVSVTDTPYAELVDAARQVNGEIYERRFKGK